MTDFSSLHPRQNRKRWNRDEMPPMWHRADISTIIHGFRTMRQSGTYLRYQFGEPQIDEMTQEQLAVKNIIVQYCSWKKYDDNAEYLDIDVVNGGMGTYITSGKAIDVTWSKDDPWGVTKYRDSNGEEIKLNLGKTWVLIVLDNYADETEIR